MKGGNMGRFLRILGLLIALLLIIYMLPGIIGETVNYLTAKKLKEKATLVAQKFQARLDSTYRQPTACERPVECNSFDFYKPYLKLIRPPRGKATTEKPHSKEIYSKVQKFFNSGKLVPEEAAEIKEKTRARIEAFKKAACCRNFSVKGTVSFKGMDANFPLNLHESIKNSKLLLYLSAYDATAGNEKEALEEFSAALRVAADLAAKKAFFLESIVALYLHNQIYACSIYLLSSREIGRAAREKLLAIIKKMNPPSNFTTASFRVEAETFLWDAAFREGIRRGIKRFPEILLYPESYYEFYIRAAKRFFSFSKALAEVSRAVEKLTDFYIEKMKKPGAEGVKELEKKMAEVSKKGPFFEILIFDFTPIYKREKTHQRLFNLVLLTCKLQNYLESKGTYPDSLEELPLESRYKIDPVTGEDFLYKKLSEKNAEVFLPPFSGGPEKGIKIRFCDCPAGDRWKEMAELIKYIRALK